MPDTCRPYVVRITRRVYDPPPDCIQDHRLPMADQLDGIGHGWYLDSSQERHWSALQVYLERAWPSLFPSTGPRVTAVLFGPFNEEMPDGHDPSRCPLCQPISTWDGDDA